MRWKIVTWITLIATNLSYILVRKRKLYYPFEEYKKMPKESLGYAYYAYLTTENIAHKPNLIRHDLKHILLNYKMNMPDELRIHTFLLGNRCYNIVSMTYLTICLIFVPENISKLKADFKRGRETLCLKKIDLQRYVHHDLFICRKIFNVSQINQIQ